MSLAACINGLESMSLSSGASEANSYTTMVEGHCVTERTPAADSIQKIGGIDGLRVTMHKLGVLPFRGRAAVASMGRVGGSRPWVASMGRVDGVVGGTHASPAAGTSSS